jgi:hypothetical protein
MTLRILTASILLLASACATTVSARDERPDPAFAKAVAGKIAGTPRSCISVQDTRDSTTYRNAIVYRVSSKLSYVNDLGNCPFLRNDNIMVTDIRGSQICRGDIVNMVDRSSKFPSGSCSFGDFVPYETPGK